MQRVHFLLLLFVVLLIGGSRGAAISDDHASSYLISTKRYTDRIDVCDSKATVTFSIHSPFGISQAVIERTADHWPEKVVLRFHLTGLERLQIQCSDTTLCASVSSQGIPLPARLWKNDLEDQPLDSTSPLWAEVHMLTGDGKPTPAIPLKDGYFEISLPQTLLASNPKSITLNWIDFYRN